MGDRVYLKPISHKRISRSDNSYSSEEDGADLRDLPKFPRTQSSLRLIGASHPKCVRSRSYSNAAPRNRLEEKKIISSYVASNLRRCQSSASYQKKRLSSRSSRPSNHKRQLQKSLSDCKNISFQDAPPSYDSTVLNKEEPRKSGILCRRSSFDYVKPTSQISFIDESKLLNVPSNFTRIPSQKSKSTKRPQCQRLTPTKEYRSKDDKHRERTETSASIPRVNLRDSAIDLVSDEEDSEAYTAVSLAGTLTGRGSAKPIRTLSTVRKQNRKFYVIIAVLCGVIVLLGGLAVTLALILFR